MKGIDPESTVVLKDRTRRKIRGLAAPRWFRPRRKSPAKKPLPLDVEFDFRQPLRRFDKSVKLKTTVSGKGVERISLGERHDVVRLRIDPKFRRKKVLEEIDITQFGDFGRRLQAVGDVGAILEEKR